MLESVGSIVPAHVHDDAELHVDQIVVRAAIEKVAARLGNTPAICRKCYVHPEVLDTYLEGRLIAEITARSEEMLRDQLAGLTSEEAAILALLRSRLYPAKSRTRTRVDTLRSNSWGALSRRHATRRPAKNFECKSGARRNNTSR